MQGAATYITNVQLINGRDSKEDANCENSSALAALETRVTYGDEALNRSTSLNDPNEYHDNRQNEQDMDKPAQRVRGDEPK